LTCYDLCLMAKSKSILGDKRLDRPHGKLVDAMIQKQRIVLRALGNNRTEEVIFGRFLINPKINPSNLVKQFWSNYPVKWEQKHLLIVEDTTTASFGLFRNRSSLGFVGKDSPKSGFHLHTALALDAENLSCYGLGAVKAYITEQQDALTRALRRKDNWKIPIEDKERYKWYSVAEEAIENCNGALRYTIVGDRECDIYDVMARFTGKKWDFVIRSASNRRLEPDLNALYSTIEQWPVQHTYSVKLPSTPKRSAHEATLELKFGSVTLVRPKSHPDKNLPEKLPLYAVEVKEQPTTIVGNEAPIHWVILTSHPIHSIEQAKQILRWYRERWVIEQTFRTLKSEGLDIENSEVETFESLANLATMALQAATQIMQLVNARNGQTDQDIEETFTPLEITCLQQLNTNLEGQTEKQKNPHPQNSLAYAAWVMARLGGWSGYTTQRPPGPITMLNGFVRFYNILEGASLRS
jgi:Transposase DDE domain